MTVHSPAEATPAQPSEAGTRYLIGRDAEGRWLAVDTRGLGGGLFATEVAASRFARLETNFQPGAIHLARRPIALRL